MKTILARRILRLNLDYALAILEGRDCASFPRRFKSIKAVYLSLP